MCATSAQAPGHGNASPARQLAGRSLSDGWVVLAPVTRAPGATGGHFSQCYIVESSEGKRAFLKALDFSEALFSPDPARALQAMTEAYNFERDLLSKCRDAKLDRIIKAIGEGRIVIPGTPAGGVVQYLIFELADGDIRSHLAAVGRLELAWTLRCLHHVATGLKQLHGQGIAHQDLKPSNVLICERSESKLADLGRAAYRGRVSPHEDCQCAGDYGYAPPELLYGFVPTDWAQRRQGCDLYLLGSMVVFFFTGLSMTSLIWDELHPSLRWPTRDPAQQSFWTGTYDQVLPYVRDAFDRATRKLGTSMKHSKLRSDLCEIVLQLCHPDPSLRGVPAGVRGMTPQFSCERYVSRFDLLERRARLGRYDG